MDIPERRISDGTRTLLKFLVPFYHIIRCVLINVHKFKLDCFYKAFCHSFIMSKIKSDNFAFCVAVNRDIRVFERYLTSCFQESRNTTLNLPPKNRNLLGTIKV
jgi:hypothetical protein